jgi:lycopene cyclase domain-containing protein
VPEYTVLTVVAIVAVTLIELCWLRSGVFRTAQYWITIAIVFGFQVLVDGWLTKLSAPIVVYRDSDVSGIRPIWSILLEEYAYAFALLTIVIALWVRAGERERA